jgi:integrase
MGKERNKDTKGFYKRGNIWWFHYSERGIQHRQSTATENFQDAIEFKRKFMGQLNSQEHNQNQNKRGYLLDFVIQKFFEEKDRTCIEKTIKLYESIFNGVLKFFKGGVIINNIVRNDIKNYEHYRLMNGLREEFLIKELKLLKNLFNFAMENEYMENNLFNNYNFNKIYRDYKPRETYINPSDFIKLLDNSNKYLKRLLIFLAETGMRIGETLSIYFSDITPYTIDKNGIERKVYTLRVRGEISKSKKDRFIPLSKEAMEQVNEQYIEFPDSLFIFTDQLGRAYKTTPKKAFETAKRRANLNFSGQFHIIRHFASTNKVKGINYKGETTEKKPRELIRKILGHNDLKTTEIYLHDVHIEDLADFIDD